MGFQNKFGWGWVGGVSSIQVSFWDFWNSFNFAKPLNIGVTFGRPTYTVVVPRVLPPPTGGDSGHDDTADDGACATTIGRSPHEDGHQTTAHQ